MKFCGMVGHNPGLIDERFHRSPTGWKKILLESCRDGNKCSGTAMGMYKKCRNEVVFNCNCLLLYLQGQKESVRNFF